MVDAACPEVRWRIPNSGVLRVECAVLPSEPSACIQYGIWSARVRFFLRTQPAPNSKEYCVCSCHYATFFFFLVDLVRICRRLPSQLELLTASGLRALVRFLDEANTGTEELEVLRAFAQDHRFLCRQAPKNIPREFFFSLFFLRNEK